MKIMISLLLCMCMLLIIMSGCSDDKNSADDVNSGVNSENPVTSNNSGTDGGLNVTGVSTNDILAIAKKYYDYHSKAMDESLKGDLDRDAGGVKFDGKLNDIDRAEELSNLANVIALMEGNGDYAVACAAAAVGFAPGFAWSAGTLAAILERAGFIEDRARLNDAEKLAEYAISLDKEDSDLYLILAQIRYYGNTDGALKAIDTALELDPDNNPALIFKLKLITKGSATGNGNSDADISSDPAVAEISSRLKNNEGELSKRDSVQENAAKGLKGPEKGDSADELLRKLHDLYKLEVITPADMVERIMPVKAREFRKQVTTLTPKEKDLKFPEFPTKLLPSARLVTTDVYDTLLDGYIEWFSRYTRNMHLGIAKLSKEALAADNARLEEAQKENPKYIPVPKDEDKSAIDFMLAYNQQVLDAARECFVRYYYERVKEYSDKVAAADPLPKWWEAEMEYLPQKGTDTGERAYVKMGTEVNKASEQYMDTFVIECSKLYTDLTAEAQLLWENMLPFARCTLMPSYNQAQLLEMVIEYPWGALREIEAQSPHKALRYFDGDLSYAQDMGVIPSPGEAQKDVELPQYFDKYEEYTFSIAVEPIEIKVTTSKVEIEYSKGAVLRGSYDWKAQQVEVGGGVSAKAKFKPVMGQEVGGEVKGTVNIVFDLKKKEVADIYILAEMKGELPTFEGGVQLRISVKSGEAVLSTTAKAKFGDIGLEYENKHEEAIIEYLRAE